MKVSIIIPVYNSEKYLQKCLEELLKQTYGNIEIIIVDDGSVDNSLTIAKSFESNGFKIISQKNAGAAVARNTGLKFASGDYIQFLDADDYISYNKIEKQVLALGGKKNLLAVCNYISFFNDVDLSSSREEKAQSHFIYDTNRPADFLVNLWGGNGSPNFIQTNSWLIPIEIIYKIGGWREYRCPDDDGEFFARAILASDGIIFVPGVYNFYRRIAGKYKLSSNKERKYIQNVLLTIDLKYKYLKAHLDDKSMHRAFAVQYLHFAVENYPEQIVLSRIAFNRFKAFRMEAQLPLLGGWIIELVKTIFGWKVARLFKHYFKYFAG